MELSEAISLIHQAPFSSHNNQTWVDLGCGSGLFTRALASLLPEGSTIYALDIESKALSAIPASFQGVQIISQRTDFISDPITSGRIDGFLMANSLHYVADKKAFLSKMKELISENALGIFIEYEAKSPNPWVPFPIDFSALSALLHSPIHKLGERPSRFGGSMYAAVAAFSLPQT